MGGHDVGTIWHLHIDGISGWLSVVYFTGDHEVMSGGAGVYTCCSESLWNELVLVGDCY